MTTSSSSRKLLPTAKTTTVFTSGNSQAVRLPKEFRVNTKTLEISRRGDEIVLREPAGTVGEFMAGLPALSKEEAAEFDVVMKSAKTGLGTLEERDLSWMDNVTAQRTKVMATSLPARSHAKRRA